MSVPRHAARRGLAALLAAGGRLLDRRAGWTTSATGRGPRRPRARRDPRHRRPAGAARRRRPRWPALSTARGDPDVAVDLPSGVAADTGAVPGRRRSGRRHRDVRRAQGLPPARAGPRAGAAGRSSSTSASTRPGRRAGAGRLGRATCGQAWPYPDAEQRQVRQGRRRRRHRFGDYPGAGIMATYGAVHGGAGMVRFLGAESPAHADHDEPAQRGVRARPGPGAPARLGLGRAGRRAPRSSPTPSTPGCPRVSTRTAWGTCPTRLPETWLLTPHAGELATLLGRRARLGRGDPRPRRPRRRPSGPARPCCSRARPSSSPEPGSPTVEVAVPGPGVDGPGGFRRHPRRALRGGARRRRARARGRAAGRVAAGASPPRPTPAAPAAGAGPPARRPSIGPVAADGRDRAGGRRDPASTRRPRARRSTWPRSARTSPRLAAHVAPAALMVVVKADAYGHGMLACAREAARRPGPSWLGVATPTEALALRAAGDTGRCSAGSTDPTRTSSPLVAADVDVSAQSTEQIVPRWSPRPPVGTRGPRAPQGRHRTVPQRRRRRTTGPSVCAAAAEAESAGALEVVGVWSHLAAADEPGHPSVALQLAAFRPGVRAGPARPGCSRELRHLANSAGRARGARGPLRPRPGRHRRRTGSSRRPGSPRLAGVTLRPAMTLRAQLALVKRIARRRRRLVRLDLDRAARHRRRAGAARLRRRDPAARRQPGRGRLVGGRRAPVRGRICMDQFVVELGPGSRRRARRRGGRCSAPGDRRRADRGGLGRGAGRSATRSSPGSAPGCRGATSRRPAAAG